MGSLAPWVIALGVSGVVALLATPLAARNRLRRSARPGRSSPWGGTSAGLALAIFVGVPFLLIDASAALVVGVLAGLGLWVFGAVGQRGQMRERVRNAALLLASVAVVAAGLRVSVTGYALGDGIVTVAVLFFAASAWRSAKTRDGLLLGWAIAVAATSGWLGGLSGQRSLEAIAAVVVGSSLAFLAYWLPPTAARLRAGGSLLIGFITVVLALDAHPSLASPRSGLIQLLLVAVPLLDGVLVAVARTRRPGIDPLRVGLAGRLRAAGHSRATTVTLLITCQLVLGVVAVFTARGVLAFAIGGIAGAVIVASLWLAALLSRLPGPRGRWPVRVVLVVCGVLVLLVVLAAPASLALFRARDSANDAISAARDGLRAAERGDSASAARDFGRAETLFNDVHQRVSGPIVAGGLLVPVLSPNLSAIRTLSALGVQLSRAGQTLAVTADPTQLRVRDGTVPLAAVARLEPSLESADQLLARSQARLRTIQRGFLVAPITKALDRLSSRVAKAERESRVAAEAGRMIPQIFGGNGPGRYFLAVENNAEARGTGGFIGNWGIITTLDGKLSLGQIQGIAVLNPRGSAVRTLHAPPSYTARYARFDPQDTWQNINMSPDLPTVGPVIADQLGQAGGGAIDGVVTVDPEGLADVLRLTGPVRVFGWPTPINASNVVDVTLRQAYQVFDRNSTERDAFLGDVANAVWHAFTSKDLGSPARIFKELSLAAREKHLGVWLANPRGQRLAESVHAAAALPRGADDLSLVTTQNAGANKLDFYLQRQVNYVVHLKPSANRRSASAQVTVQVQLTNTAPSSGLPQEVIGPNISTIGPGVNRSYVTVYTRLPLERAALNGLPLGLESQPEFGSLANATYIDIPPRSSQTLSVVAGGTMKLGPGGTYTLDLARQALTAPDGVNVEVDVPAGWRLQGLHGLRLARGGRQATFTGQLTKDLQLGAQVAPSSNASLLERLRAGP
jgi:hypothetical protein